MTMTMSMTMTKPKARSHFVFNRANHVKRVQSVQNKTYFHNRGPFHYSSTRANLSKQQHLSTWFNVRVRVCVRSEEGVA